MTPMPRNSSRVMCCGIEAGVLQRLPYAGSGQRHGARYVGPVFHLHVAGFIELVGYLPGDLHLKRRRVEARDAPHSADTVAAGLPKGFPTDSIGAHRANSRYRHATHFYDFAFPRLLSIG